MVRQNFNDTACVTASVLVTSGPSCFECGLIIWTKHKSESTIAQIIAIILSCIELFARYQVRCSCSQNLAPSCRFKHVPKLSLSARNQTPLEYKVVAISTMKTDILKLCAGHTPARTSIGRMQAFVSCAHPTSRISPTPGVKSSSRTRRFNSGDLNQHSCREYDGSGPIYQM